MRRALFALPLAVAVVASCTYDFEAPFAQSGASSSTASSSSGSSGNGEGGASEGGVVPTADGGCTFREDWETPAKNTFPISWFRLDESEPNDFKGSKDSKVTVGFRKTNTTRIPYGAVRSPNGAQHMGSIGFGDVWPQLNGGVSGELAVAFWFRTAEVQGGDSIVLLSKVHDSPSRKGITVRLTGTGQLAIHREGGVQPINYEMGRIDSIRGWNRWHHLVLQRRDFPKPLLQFYIDGVGRDYPDDVAPSYVATNDPFMIGPFDGDVDELLAYDHLLTQSDVWALIDGAASGACRAGNRSVCYGPQALGQCNGAMPEWAENCPGGQLCVVENGTPKCVEKLCGK